MVIAVRHLLTSALLVCAAISPAWAGEIVIDAVVEFENKGLVGASIDLFDQSLDKDASIKPFPPGVYVRVFQPRGLESRHLGNLITDEHGKISGSFSDIDLPASGVFFVIPMETDLAVVSPELYPTTILFTTGILSQGDDTFTGPITIPKTPIGEESEHNPAGAAHALREIYQVDAWMKQRLPPYTSIDQVVVEQFPTQAASL